MSMLVSPGLAVGLGSRGDGQLAAYLPMRVSAQVLVRLAGFAGGSRGGVEVMGFRGPAVKTALPESQRAGWSAGKSVEVDGLPENRWGWMVAAGESRGRGGLFGRVLGEMAGG